MPIPGCSLVAPAEFITAAEAVETVVEGFKSSACTQTEACAWLSEQVRNGKLKLVWTDKSPEHLGGLHLTGEGFVFIPGLPGARALDALDWSTGELCRRLRIAESIYREARGIDPSKLTFDELLARDSELLARYGCDTFDGSLPGEWITEELKYRFGLKRVALLAILDAVTLPPDKIRVPLWDAAGVIANRLNISFQQALDAIVEAAATKRIKIHGTPQHNWQGDRIRARAWRKVARGEVTLSTNPSAEEIGTGSWSELCVFRADLEQLARELAGNSAAESGRTEPPPSAAALQTGPASDSCAAEGVGQLKAPRDSTALRGKARKWLAAYVASRKHRNRDNTLEAMRAAHPGLGVRGSLAVWGEFAKENPQLQLSRPGAKLKRNTNN